LMIHTTKIEKLNLKKVTNLKILNPRTNEFIIVQP
jgi:hypothetical protein